MPSIRIDTPAASLAALAKAACARAGFGSVDTRNTSVKCCTLRHRAETPPPAITVLARTFIHFAPEVMHDPRIGVDIALTLGDTGGAALSRHRTMVGADTERLRQRLTNDLRRLGFSGKPPSVCMFSRNILKYGGAGQFALAVVRLQLTLHDIEVEVEQVWGETDMDIYMLVCDPDEACKPLPARVPVTVRTDDPSVFVALQAPLAKAGFTRVSMAAFEPRAEPRLAILPGPLTRLGGHIETAVLAGVLDEAGRAAGIDYSRYPLQLPESSGASALEDRAEIHIPIAAIRAGTALPWAPDAPERYPVKILDDDPLSGRNLELRLHAARFRRTERGRLDKITLGFVLHVGTDVPPAVREAVRGAVIDAMAAAGVTGFDLVVQKGPGTTITIEYPISGCASGRLLAELTAPARHSFRVVGPTAATCKVVADAERKGGWRSVSTSVDVDEDPPGILYGGAHPALIERLQRSFEATYGVVLPARKCWGLDDMDVFFRLPTTMVLAPAAAVAAQRTGATPAPQRSSAVTARSSFITLTAQEIVIGDIALPRRQACHPLVPDLASFDSLVIDQPCAETLSFLAEAWTQRHHIALEGSTGVSKTFLITYFAALIGLPMFRVNLTATSDSADLLGRVVQDIDRPGVFKWVNGAVPSAMRTGGLLVLDEANLAPTELLERCNGALEPNPRLVLSEHDGRVILGADVHPDFRVFASWNGSDYAGRQELAPSFKDRFELRMVPPAAEADYIALGRRLVHGEQPPVEVHDIRYVSHPSMAPVLPRLRQIVPDIDRFIVALARLQVALEKASTDAVGGAQRAVYTRRSFIAALRLMHDRLTPSASGKSGPQTAVRAAWRALNYSHFERLMPAEKGRAIDLAAACGVRAEGWDLPS